MNGVTYEEIMQKLEELGSEQTKQIYNNHGVKEPYYWSGNWGFEETC